jgi:pimeloyl-ACP methyl ester carboxylesterase
MSKAEFLARYHCVIEPFDPPKPDRLGIPILILEADNDPLVSEKLRAMLQDTYASATLQCLGSVGHFPYLNEPALYAQKILRFLGGEPQARSR